MNGKELTDMSGINTCYSYITDKEAVSVAAVYAAKDGKIVAVPNSGGVSPGGFLGRQDGGDFRRKLAEEHPYRDVDLIEAIRTKNKTPLRRGFCFWPD
jgi:hypothetical protein